MVEQIPEILGNSFLKKSDFAVGKSKIFCKQAAHNALDNSRRFAYSGLATRIQANYRGYLARKRVKMAIEVNKDMNAFMKQYPLYSATNTHGLLLIGKCDTVTMPDPLDVKKIKAGCDLFKTNGIDKSYALVVKGSKATPTPPILSKFEACTNSMKQELEIYEKVDKWLTSLDVLGIDEQCGLLKKLKIADKVTEKLDWRSENIATQLPLIKALQALDLAQKEISIDQESQITQFSDVLDACAEAKVAGDASVWVDAEGAQLWTKANALYKDVESRNKVKMEELKKKKATEEAAAEEAEKARIQKESKALDEAEKTAQADGDTIEVQRIQQRRRTMMQGGKVRKKTIMGVAAEKQEAIVKKIEDAKMDFDHYALKCLLELAVQAGIDKEELDIARAVFKDLHSDVYVEAELHKIKKLLADEDPDAKLNDHEKRFYVKRTNNLIKIGKRMKVDAQLLDDTSKFLRKLMGRQGTMFHKGGNKEDLQNAMDTYSDLSTCPLLNEAATKPKHLDDGRTIMPADEGGSLSWTRHKLTAPLTRLPESAVSGALSVFRNTLGWMNDKPVPERRRAQLAYAIVSFCVSVFVSRSNTDMHRCYSSAIDLAESVTFGVRA